MLLKKMNKDFHRDFLQSIREISVHLKVQFDQILSSEYLKIIIFYYIFVLEYLNHSKFLVSIKQTCFNLIKILSFEYPSLSLRQFLTPSLDNTTEPR